MTAIRLNDSGFDVDAELIGTGLHLEAARVPILMREGKIVARCDRGEAEDSGRYRLTFLHGDRRLHLIVDERGHVIETATFESE